MKVKDKEFEYYISEKRISKRVKELAIEINRGVQTSSDNAPPLFLSVLTGSFMFASDLVKNINIPIELTFIKVASYEGTNSSEKVTTLIGLDRDIKNRDIIILEDIIDTGLTMKYLISDLNKHKPKSIKIVTLFLKRESLTIPIEPDYIGFEIKNEFIIGYGLDYCQIGRNLKDIYINKPRR